MDHSNRHVPGYPWTRRRGISRTSMFRAGVSPGRGQAHEFSKAELLEIPMHMRSARRAVQLEGGSPARELATAKGSALSRAAALIANHGVDFTWRGKRYRIMNERRPLQDGSPSEDLFMAPVDFAGKIETMSILSLEQHIDSGKIMIDVTLPARWFNDGSRSIADRLRARVVKPS